MFHIVSEDVKMAVGRTWGRAWSLQHCATRLTGTKLLTFCQSLIRYTCFQNQLDLLQARYYCYPLVITPTSKKAIWVKASHVSYWQCDLYGANYMTSQEFAPRTRNVKSNPHGRTPHVLGSNVPPILLGSLQCPKHGTDLRCIQMWYTSNTSDESINSEEIVKAKCL